MKQTQFIIFLSIVLTIYSLINFYLLRRSWQSLAAAGGWRIAILVFLLLLVLAYPVGRFLERVSFCGWTHGLVYLGSFYLGIMAYAFLLTLVIDLLRLGNHFFGFFPQSLVQNPQKAGLLTFGISLALIVLPVVAGYFNARAPRVREVNLSISKPAGEIKELHIVAMSDIHLGTLIRNSRLERLVEMVNELKPDLVLLPGDVVDEDIGPVARQNMDGTLRKLKATYGVFGITGNHEYYGGVWQTVAYLKQSGIRMLQDEVIKIADAFYLAGRKDITAVQMEGGRKPLREILAGADSTLPIILMDHQPFRLEAAQQNGVDLQISGHTHHGQFFPFNLITNRVYEKSWGYLRKGRTQYYVSCGVGTWGPPIRLGNRPEIVSIHLKFTSSP